MPFSWRTFARPYHKGGTQAAFRMSRRSGGSTADQAVQHHVRCLDHQPERYLWQTPRITPAMAAGLTNRVWDMADFIALMDAAAPKPGRPKTYRKAQNVEET